MRPSRAARPMSSAIALGSDRASEAPNGCILIAPMLDAEGTMSALSTRDLVNLVRSAFPRFETDKRLAVFVDIPRDPASDNEAWRIRRAMAADWVEALNAGRADIPIVGVALIAYLDVGSNNAELPGLGVCRRGAASGLGLGPGRRRPRGPVRRGLPELPDHPRSDRILDHGPAQERRPDPRFPGRDHARIRRLDDPRPADRLCRGRAALPEAQDPA